MPNLSSIMINSRALTMMHPLNEELKLQAGRNYLFDLSYLSALFVQGENARTFLQGQMTCNLDEVTQEEIRQGALCNLKGRVLSLWDILRFQDGFVLIGPEDLVGVTEVGLNKFALLSRVTLSPLTGYKVFGFYLQNPTDLMPLELTMSSEPLEMSSDQNYHSYHLGNQLFIILIKQEAVSKHFSTLIENQQCRGSLAWHNLCLQQQHFQIYPESRGLFLPHDLGLQNTGYLSFNKGCYKGQEIIARMHYRAKLKYKLSIFVISSQESLYSGQKILSLDKKNQYGELVDYSPMGDSEWLIATSILLDHPDEVQLDQQEHPISLKKLV